MSVTASVYFSSLIPPGFVADIRLLVAVSRLLYLCIMSASLFQSSAHHRKSVPHSYSNYKWLMRLYVTTHLVGGKRETLRSHKDISFSPSNSQCMIAAFRIPFLITDCHKGENNGPQCCKDAILKLCICVSPSCEMLLLIRYIMTPPLVLHFCDPWWSYCRDI